MEYGVDFAFEGAFGEGADDLVDRLAVLEKDEGGDAADAVLHGNVGVVVHVDFGDVELAVVFEGEVVDGGGDHFAGAAPFGPEVHEDGEVGAFDLGFPSAFVDVDGFGHLILQG